jgi:hypothetical protein
MYLVLKNPKHLGPKKKLVYCDGLVDAQFFPLLLGFLKCLKFVICLNLLSCVGANLVVDSCN